MASPGMAVPGMAVPGMVLPVTVSPSVGGGVTRYTGSSSSRTPLVPSSEGWGGASSTSSW